MIKLINQADYQNKNWKNGRGTTQEIAISQLSPDFDWRMSMADIVESGPFSSFPGMDRVLVLITGPEIIISHLEVETDTTLPLLSPYKFSGDWQTSARVSGKGKDFNLIYQRDKFNGSIELIHLAGGESKLQNSKNVTAIFCLEGKIETNLGELRPYDTLLIENDACRLLAQEKSTCLLIQLNHI